MILDVIVPPLLRLLDIYNLVNRYICSPYSKSQALMNRGFNGTFWNLAERYTDQMKKVFFCFFYAWVCPSGFGISGKYSRRRSEHREWSTVVDIFITIIVKMFFSSLRCLLCHYTRL